MKKVTLLYTLLTIVVLGVGIYWGYQLLQEPEKSVFLIGESSPGHHQIEQACETCHQTPFGGGEVLQDACVGCHAAELKDAHDSHPKSKFTDPRNANRLDQIDARYCMACHREHQPDQTREISVTLPADYCVACHQDIAEDRTSHEGMEFDTCASAGCHNYHDNRALYEDFLLAHAGEPDMNPKPVIASMKDYLLTAESSSEGSPQTPLQPDYPEQNAKVTKAIEEWHGSAHSADVNCSGCHQSEHANTANPQFSETPDALVCVECHESQAKGFLRGKHGMRLAIHTDATQSFPLNQSLTALTDPGNRLFDPMTPAQGRLPFKGKSHAEELTCNSCHGSHDYKLGVSASVDACMGCHDDQHTNAYQSSPHYGIVLKEQAGEVPKGSAVTCATCHMPKVEDEHQEGVYHTSHNQNENLRPNEKMIRSVCLDCHGLQFALDSLADPILIENNFNGRPTKQIDSINLAIEREKE